MAGNETDNKPGKVSGDKLRARFKDKLRFRSKSNDNRAACDFNSSSVLAGHRDLPASSPQPTQTPAENGPVKPATTPTSGPISELWNQAYEDLRTEEDVLVRDYEASLSKYLRVVNDPAKELSSSKIERNDQMATILKEKMDEVARNAWKLRFGNGKDVPLKDAIQPVISIIESANDFIGKALSANPYASLAWSGLLLNPSSQAASLAKGLAYISNLIAQSSMREELYNRRYELESVANGVNNPFRASHSVYKETLKELYIQILKFQATSVCYYSKNSAFRIGLDMVKWDSWDSLLSEVTTQETAFAAINDVWKDKRYDEECEALIKRHQESMETLNTINTDISSLRKAVEDAQLDITRRGLLDWLSSVDPSEN